MPMIMYICDGCFEGDNEICGHLDRSELVVTPEGEWLCENCISETKYTIEEQKKFSVPPEYKPTV